MVAYIKNLGKRTIIVWVVDLALFTWFGLCLPAYLFDAPTSFVITDKDGNLLNASIAADGQWRFPYQENTPEKFVQCITTFEDKRFFYHPGVDPLALARAVLQNIRNGAVVSGGSTLSMQVIRMQQQNSNRSIWNKFSETILALRLEFSYNKQQVLALYASNAPFGGNVVGLEAAAWRYYGRAPASLSWGEMAALAVLPNAPSLVHPGRNRDILLRKRNGLLDKLASAKIIDSTTADLAKLEPLPGAPKPLPQLAPHLLDRFKKDYAGNANKREGALTAAETTLSKQLQEQVNNLILRYHQQLRGNQINNAAAMVIEINTGNVLAYVGNVYLPEDSTLQSSVDVLASKRSPGSTLKPLLYASLLTEGKLLPRQLVPDIPTQVSGYMPENFDLGYDGAVPANRALARSLNIPAVRMLMQYKYQKFYDVLTQCGFTTLNKPADFYGMSLILGGCEISPWELAGVYSSMARMYNQEKNNGEKWNGDDWFMPRYLASPGNESPTTVQHPASQLFDYTSMWHTFNAMNEVMRPGEEGLWGLFSSAQRIAWKTGTSFGFRDGWAIGLTPKYCVIVWVGNTTGEGRPDLTGITTAAPVMFDIFRLLPSSPWFKAPSSGFIYMPVCHESGFKAGPDCISADTIMASENARNASPCPYHRVIHLDPSAAYRVTEDCISPSRMQHLSWFVLPPTIEYYYRQRHPAYKTLPPFMQGCSNETVKPLDIIYPADYAKIYVPLELSGERGKTVFAATTRSSAIKLFWHLDDTYIGTTQQFHQMAVNPPPGKHILTVEDENGESISCSFEILNKGGK